MNQYVLLAKTYFILYFEIIKVGGTIVKKSRELGWEVGCGGAKEESRRKREGVYKANW